jgi:hypothetical protein
MGHAADASQGVRTSDRFGAKAKGGGSFIVCIDSSRPVAKADLKGYIIALTTLGA